MKLLLIVFLFFAFSFASAGQTPKADSPQGWYFKFDTTNQKSIFDSTKIVCRITFYRNKPVIEKVPSPEKNLESRRTYKPTISFEIFHSKDSLFCSSISKRVKTTSNCLPPEVGGDIYLLGEFIFVNVESCVLCISEDRTVDYCRPILNQVLKKIYTKKMNTLEDLKRQFLIQKLQEGPAE